MDDQQQALPEPVAEVALESPPDRKGRSGRIIASVVVLALLVGGLAAVSLRPGPKDPDDVVHEIAAFVADADSVHIEGVQESSSRSGEGELGSTYSDRSKVRGDLLLPSTSHLVVHDGMGVWETITVGDVSYDRQAEDEAGLDDEVWVQTQLEGEDLEWSAEQLAALAEDGGLAGSLGQGLALNQLLAGAGYGFPELDRLLSGLDGATRVSDDVVAVELPVPELLALMEPKLEDIDALDEIEGDVRIELTSGPGGRLDRMRTTVTSEMAGEQMTNVDDLRFSRWGGEVEISAPDASEVDQTPSFDEEQLLDGGFTPLAPRVVPDPLRLLGATFYEAAEDSEECSEVYLYYADPAEEQRQLDWQDGDPDVFVHSLELTMSAASCTADDEYEEEFRDENGEPQPVVVGPHRGTIVRYDDDDYGPTVELELVVGEVKVSVVSDLGEELTLAALADLVPLDLQQQPVLELSGP